MENEIITLLNSINNNLSVATSFIQLLFYCFIGFILIYYGYWFFSRFFY